MKLGLLDNFIQHIQTQYHHRETHVLVVRVPEHKGGWQNCEKPSRTPETLFLGDKMLDITKTMTNFIRSESWCKDNGQPFHTTLFFSGKPGTGKTSMASVLANIFHLQLYLLNGGALTRQSMEDIKSGWLKTSLIVLDDFHRVKFRDESRHSADDEITYADFLAFVDGPHSLHGAILIIISNDTYENEKEKRPELFRSGRVDSNWQFSPPDETQRLAMLQRLYKDNKLPNKDQLLRELAEAMKDRVSQADIAKLARIRRDDLSDAVDNWKSLLNITPDDSARIGNDHNGANLQAEKEQDRP